MSVGITMRTITTLYTIHTSQLLLKIETFATKNHKIGKSRQPTCFFHYEHQLTHSNRRLYIIYTEYIKFTALRRSSITKFIITNEEFDQQIQCKYLACVWLSVDYNTDPYCKCSVHLCSGIL